MPSILRKRGDKGEDIAVKYLLNNRFEILDRNYLKKWGEIDIVAKKSGTLHVIEVKTIYRKGSVSRENDSYEPLENIHSAKKRKFSRIIETYLEDKDISESIDYQVDAISIILFDSNENPEIDFLEDVVL